MKTLSKLIFALCVSSFLTVPLATAQTANDPEIKQILAAAKAYIKSPGGSELKFRKKVNNYALVDALSKYKHEGEGREEILLIKTGSKWVVKDMSTSLQCSGYEWLPAELFK